MNGFTENRRVLVIDDNQSIHEDFRKILAPGKTDAAAAFGAAEAALFGNSAGSAPNISFDVSSAFQGEEGISMVQRSVDEGAPYAVAFVDVRMPPGLDGIETTCRILQIDPLIQIVICTAYADYSWDEIFAKIGNHDGLLILKKPFDSVEALQLAYALSEKWGLHQRAREKMEDLERRVVHRTRELQRAKDFAENIIQTANLMFVQMDASGRVVRVNAALEEVSGYRFVELMENDCLQTLIPAEQMFQELKRFNGAEGDGQVLPDTVEIPLITKEGQQRRVIWRTSVLYEGAEIVGTISFGLDVTERQKLENQLVQAQKLETVGKLAGGVAHEFNNLLMAILGQTDLLLGELPNESPLRSNATSIQAGAERAAILTRQLLAYGRRQLLRVETIDLNRVLLRMEKMIRHLMGDKIEVDFVLSPDLYSVNADAGQIEQVIVNLASNSRDAMPTGGSFVVETESVTLGQETEVIDPDLEPGDYARVSVRDTGCGMSEDVLARAFEPFFTTKGIGEGTGLGLSTCYGILKQSGGHITLASESGKGTTFTLYLPGFRASKSPETSASSTHAEPHGGTETILLIEPERSLREVSVMFLKKLGYSVLAADNGKNALNLVEGEVLAGSVDLLLADVNMLHADGDILRKRLRALHPSAKTLLTSPDGATSASYKGSAESEFLQKPFTPTTLARRIREILDRAATCSETS